MFIISFGWFDVLQHTGELSIWLMVLLHGGIKFIFQSLIFLERIFIDALEDYAKDKIAEIEAKNPNCSSFSSFSWFSLLPSSTLYCRPERLLKSEIGFYVKNTCKIEQIYFFVRRPILFALSFDDWPASILERNRRRLTSYFWSVAFFSKSYRSVSKVWKQNVINQAYSESGIRGIGSQRWNWKFREKHFWNPKNIISVFHNFFMVAYLLMS